MTGRAAVPDAFVMGVDCLAPIPPGVPAQLRQHGFVFVGRYLETLTVEEIQEIGAEGLLVLPVTEAVVHVPLTEELGLQRGAQSVSKALRLGIPPGVHITIDLEAVAPESDAAAYVNAFADTLVHGGYSAMLYAGSGQPLNGAQLYGLRPDRYWRAGSFGVPEPGCGWCVQQLSPLDTMVCGIRVDVDVIHPDHLGRLPTLWAP